MKNRMMKFYIDMRETRWDGKREDEIREKRCRSVGGLLK